MVQHVTETEVISIWD